MQHEAHVGLVDPKPEGHRRDNHLQPAGVPGRLHRLPRARVAARVVRRTRHPPLGQPRLDLLRVRPREGVDDPRQAARRSAAGGGVVPPAEGGHLVEQALLRAGLGAHRVSDVGAVEVAAEADDARGVEAEAALDVGAHGVGGGGGEGEDGHGGEGGAQDAQ
eukprot:scaffold38104_cov60-Phaeocystis_antarctica.AAC.3